MIRINEYIYNLCETGDLIKCGKVIMGVDGEFIEWYE